MLALAPKVLGAAHTQLTSLVAPSDLPLSDVWEAIAECVAEVDDDALFELLCDLAEITSATARRDLVTQQTPETRRRLRLLTTHLSPESSIALAWHWIQTWASPDHAPALDSLFSVRTNEEMKELMLNACRQMEKLLKLKNEHQKEYEHNIRSYNLRYCGNWER